MIIRPPQVEPSQPAAPELSLWRIITIDRQGKKVWWRPLALALAHPELGLPQPRTPPLGVGSPGDQGGA